MASVGYLERVVELHDTGVFRDAAKSLGTEEFPVRYVVMLVSVSEMVKVILSIGDAAQCVG
jgi:hypothetical protein